MLVLLVIFMITAPLKHNNISIDLPQPNPNVKPPENPPAPKTLFIQANGTLLFDNVQLPCSAPNIQQCPALQAQLTPIGRVPVEQQPQVNIKAADNTPYDYLAQVMAAARGDNVQKIGFEK